MRSLNRRYRGKDRPTDVLSFPMEDLNPRMLSLLKKRQYVHLGDIVICPAWAQKNMRTKNEKALYKEIRVLLIHGLLHLLGYEHEKGGPDEKKMRNKEQELLNALKEMD
jgi:probable rRNA maturation factor